MIYKIPGGYIVIILGLLACLFVLAISIRKLKKINSEFRVSREKFIEYLNGVHDIETLKRIGEINFLGAREKWYPAYTNVVSYLGKKIEETNDKNFIEYLIEYKKFIRGFLCTTPFIVLSIIVPLNIVVYLIVN